MQTYLHDMADYVRRHGRFGDTELAHVTKRELGILKFFGGAGTRNPYTGLLEFYNVADSHLGAAEREGYGGGGGFSGGARGGGSQAGRGGPRDTGGVTGATRSRSEAQSAAAALHDAMEKNPRPTSSWGSGILGFLGSLFGGLFGGPVGAMGGGWLGKKAGSFIDRPLTGQERQVDAMLGGGWGGSPGSAPNGQGGGGRPPGLPGMMGPGAGAPGTPAPGQPASPVVPTTPRTYAPPPPGYRPGIDPEWNYFTQPPAAAPKAFAEGGPVPQGAGDPKQLIVATVAAIKGQVPNPEAVIQAFIQAFGRDAFIQLRSKVMQEMQGGGGAVSGPGGGLADAVPATIDGQEPAKLSSGEFVVPADVVAHMGDGDTRAGNQKLQSMVSRARMAKTGTQAQPQPMPDRILPV